MDSIEKRPASKHVSAMLYPSEMHFTIADLYSTRGDGLCIAEKNPSHCKITISARKVDPHQVDLKTVKTWLSDCERLHPPFALNLDPRHSRTSLLLMSTHAKSHRILLRNATTWL